MIYVVMSAALGAVMGWVKPGLARLIFLGWLTLVGVVIGPLLLMPDPDNPFQQGAASTMVALPLALGAGWLLGRMAGRLTGRAA